MKSREEAGLGADSVSMYVLSRRGIRSGDAMGIQAAGAVSSSGDGCIRACTGALEVGILSSHARGSQSMSKLNGRQQHAAERAQHAAERAEKAVQEVGPRLDKQDATLRLIWAQCGGEPNRHLPIDD